MCNARGEQIADEEFDTDTESDDGGSDAELVARARSLRPKNWPITWGERTSSISGIGGDSQVADPVPPAIKDVPPVKARIRERAGHPSYALAAWLLTMLLTVTFSRRQGGKLRVVNVLVENLLVNPPGEIRMARMDKS